MLDEENHELALFEQKQLRRVWHEGEWYYSITALTDSANPRVYWGS
jgi:hypothetical protein